MSSLQVVSGGRTVRYDVTGVGEQAVLLLPALGTTCEVWEQQVRHLRSAYTVLTADLGSHTKHGGAPRHTLDDFVRDAIAILDAVGSTDAHVVGLSIGGMIAQVLAIRHADRVRSLTLVSTTSRYSGERRQALLDRAERAESHGMESLVEPTLRRWFTEEFREAGGVAVDAVAGMLRTADPATYAEGARAAANGNTSATLSEIDIPALVLSGADDQSLPDGAVTELTRELRDVRQVSIQNSAHLCHLERPDRFGAALGQFLLETTEDVTDPRVSRPASPW